MVSAAEDSKRDCKELNLSMLGCCISVYWWLKWVPKCSPLCEVSFKLLNCKLRQLHFGLVCHGYLCCVNGWRSTAPWGSTTGVSWMRWCIPPWYPEGFFQRKVTTLAGTTRWPACSRAWSILLIASIFCSVILSACPISRSTSSSGIKSSIYSFNFNSTSNLADKEDLCCLSFGILGPPSASNSSLSWPSSLVTVLRCPLLNFLAFASSAIVTYALIIPSTST